MPDGLSPYRSGMARCQRSVVAAGKPHIDTAADIHRQNVQKARAMARMAIYDALLRQARDVFKESPLPVEPSPDEICEVVERAGVRFDKRGRMIVSSEYGRH